jgi:hypothetical protein
MKFTRRGVLCPVVAGSLALVITQASSSAAVAYLRSQDGPPWNQSTNETAMTTVFGTSWDDLRFETANAATLFSSSYSFLYLEGGDQTANELEAFFTTNQSLIESWVFNGGSLFINAAPNEGNGMNLGFGGVTLSYPNFSSTAYAVDPTDEIFQGPYGATGSSFTGGYFSHAAVSGGSINPLIGGESGTVLAEKDWGSGFVIFGGMTTNNFQQPLAETADLRANIIDYAAGQGGEVSAIPEPGQAVALGFLLAGGFVFRRRPQRLSAR